jgi:hypothetical protein
MSIPMRITSRHRERSEAVKRGIEQQVLGLETLRLGAAFRAAGRCLEDHVRQILEDMKRRGSAAGELS